RYRSPRCGAGPAPERRPAARRPSRRSGQARGARPRRRGTERGGKAAWSLSPSFFFDFKGPLEAGPDAELEALEAVLRQGAEVLRVDEPQRRPEHRQQDPQLDA